MPHVDIISLLEGLPPEIIYLTVFFVVGIESLGIPLPGEITLMSASFISSGGDGNPFLIWVFGATGAIVGDSIGYYVGHRHGYKLINKLSKWFPHHFNPRMVDLAKKVFHRHGIKVVFFGRFIALLRVFAGPLAGILKLPYKRFLIANALGGIVWSGLVVWVVYFLGLVAEHWFKKLSWIGFGIAMIMGIAISIAFQRRVNKYLEENTESQSHN